MSSAVKESSVVKDPGGTLVSKLTTRINPRPGFREKHFGNRMNPGDPHTSTRYVPLDPEPER